MAIQIITNHRWRDLVSWHDLPPKVATSEFDYVTGEDQWSLRFVKYKGDWLDAGDVMAAPDSLKTLGWYGFNSDSFYSGIAYRWSKDCDRVMLALVLS